MALQSPKTIKNYGDAARQLVAYLEQAGMPTTAAGVHREHVEAFLIHLGEARSASTVATRSPGPIPSAIRLEISRKTAEICARI